MRFKKLMLFVAVLQILGEVNKSAATGGFWVSCMSGQSGQDRDMLAEIQRSRVFEFLRANPCMSQGVFVIHLSNQRCRTAVKYFNQLPDGERMRCLGAANARCLNGQCVVDVPIPGSFNSNLQALRVCAQGIFGYDEQVKTFKELLKSGSGSSQSPRKRRDRSRTRQGRAQSSQVD